MPEESRHLIILDKAECVKTKINTIVQLAEQRHDFLEDPEIVRDREVDEPIELAMDEAQALLTNLCSGDSIGEVSLVSVITQLENCEP